MQSTYPMDVCTGDQTPVAGDKFTDLFKCSQSGGYFCNTPGSRTIMTQHSTQCSPGIYECRATAGLQFKPMKLGYTGATCKDSAECDDGYVCGFSLEEGGTLHCQLEFKDACFQ